MTSNYKNLSKKMNNSIFDYSYPVEELNLGRHTLTWNLKRPPEEKDLTLIEECLFNNKARFIRGNKREKHYRISFKDDISIHIIINFGVERIHITAHIDLSPHDEVYFNDQTKILLNRISFHLISHYGKTLMVQELPRHSQDLIESTHMRSKSYTNVAYRVSNPKKFSSSKTDNSRNTEQVQREKKKFNERIDFIRKGIQQNLAKLTFIAKVSAVEDALLNKENRIDRKKLRSFTEKNIADYIGQNINDLSHINKIIEKIKKSLKINYDKLYVEANFSLRSIAPYLKYEEIKFKGLNLSKPRYVLLLLHTCLRNYDKPTFFKNLRKNQKIRIDNHSSILFSLVKLARRTLEYNLYSKLIYKFCSWNKQFKAEFSKNLLRMFRNMLLKRGAGEDFPISTKNDLLKRIYQWNKYSKDNLLHIEVIDVFYGLLSDIKKGSVKPHEFEEIVQLIKSCCSRSELNEVLRIMTSLKY